MVISLCYLLPNTTNNRSKKCQKMQQKLESTKNNLTKIIIFIKSHRTMLLFTMSVMYCCQIVSTLNITLHLSLSWLWIFAKG